MVNQINLVNTISLPLDGVENVSIAYQAECISLKHSFDEKFLVQEYMDQKEPELTAEIEQTKNTICLRHVKRGDSLYRFIEVYIPADWKGSLSILTIDGSISTQCDWCMSSFDVQSVYGNVELATVTADKIKLTSYVGSLFLGCCTGNIDLRTVNGSIRADKVFGGGSVSTINGNQQLFIKKINKPLRASSENGEICLSLPQSPTIELNAVSETGAIYSSSEALKIHPGRHQFHCFAGEAPYHNVEISTTSGNIHISDSL